MNRRNDWYGYPPPDPAHLLSRLLDNALAQGSHDRVTLFFRADDIGVPGPRFFQMLTLCMRYDIPLGLALVPAWTTAARWETILRAVHRKSHLWCWHQHGWRHVNHESTGKKQEFGPSRNSEDIHSDLQRGRLRLESILGDDFFPLFTPPWNRCDERTMAHLSAEKYVALSRFAESRPEAPTNLPDLFVNVDLHTRKGSDPKRIWADLLNEFSQAFASGYCGIMLHHQRISPAAFTFLELLFSFVIDSKHIQLTTFDRMVGPL